MKSSKQQVYSLPQRLWSRQEWCEDSSHPFSNSVNESHCAVPVEGLDRSLSSLGCSQQHHFPLLGMYGGQSGLYHSHSKGSSPFPFPEQEEMGKSKNVEENLN